MEQGAGGEAVGQVGVVDLQPPGQGGGLAEELLVEPVAQPPDGLGDEEGGRDGVGEGPEPEPTPVQDPGSHGDTGGHGAPHAQAALPDLRDERRVPVRAEVRVRGGQHVVQAGAEDADGHGKHGDVVGAVRVAPACPVAPVGPPGREEDAREHAQGVGAQREGPEVPHALRGAGDGQRQERSGGQHVRGPLGGRR